MTRLLRDASLSAVVAGLVTVLVGITSSAVVVFEAARALGASPAEIGSWMFALGLAIGATSIGLSLWLRVPVITAWSTPGAAMMVTSVAGVTMPQAIGAFMVCAALIVAVGLTGWFERAMRRIPHALGSAMLAGVLLRIALDAFALIGTAPLLVLAMLLAYLIARRWWPRYAVLLVLLIGVVIAGAQGLLHPEALRLQRAQPIFIWPEWSPKALIGVALPLFIVTMASQNVPGVAVLRASGYAPPISPLMTATGAATLVLAPFGAYAVNLAAITAAISTGPDAHPDPARRYVASVTAGACYVAIGVFGATVAGLFAAFPRAMVIALAGLALLGTIGAGLAAAMREDQHREAALLTFAITASGLTLFGIGAAFWGLAGGLLATAILESRDRLP